MANPFDAFPTKDNSGSASAHTNEEKKNESEWTDIPIETILRVSSELQKYEDENGEVKNIPEIFQLNGKLNKDLFAGLLMFKAPQYLLFSSDTGQEALQFLTNLNEKLKDEELLETIKYLKEQLPYLDASDAISDRAFSELDKVEEDAKSADPLDFTTLNKRLDASLAGSKANLLRVKVGGEFTRLMNKTYDALWDKYLKQGYVREPIKALGMGNEHKE